MYIKNNNYKFKNIEVIINLKILNFYNNKIIF